MQPHQAIKCTTMPPTRELNVNIIIAFCIIVRTDSHTHTHDCRRAAPHHRMHTFYVLYVMCLMLNYLHAASSDDEIDMHILVLPHIFLIHGNYKGNGIKYI